MPAHSMPSCIVLPSSHSEDRDDQENDREQHRGGDYEFTLGLAGTRAGAPHEPQHSNSCNPLKLTGTFRSLPRKAMDSHRYWSENMAGEKPDVLLLGTKKPVIVSGLQDKVNLHYLADAKDQDAFIKEVAPKIRAIAVAYTANKIDAAFMSQFPKLELVSSFRRRLRPCRCEVGGRARHHRDQHAGRAQRGGRRHRARPAALRRCANCRRPSAICAPANGRRGQLSADQATLRDRTVGMVGMGRIGKAIARRHRGVRRAGRLSQPQSAAAA